MFYSRPCVVSVGALSEVFPTVRNAASAVEYGLCGVSSTHRRSVGGLAILTRGDETAEEAAAEKNGGSDTATVWGQDAANAVISGVIRRVAASETVPTLLRRCEGRTNANAIWTV
jgi:hypothetical protein